MESVNEINQKIIDAVIAKAEKICPNSLALIGVYGSVATGETHEKSDLDLLILIDDEEGYKLATGFILDDIGVGYDIYCTNWDALRWDSECHYAQISKLMDSKIVCIKNQKAYEELCALRENTKAFLASEERFQRVEELLGKAKMAYANAHLHEELAMVRLDAAEVLNNLFDAIMIYHGTYFKRSDKSVFEELAAVSVAEKFMNHAKAVCVTKDVAEIRDLLKKLILYMEELVKQEKVKEEPSTNLIGCYEEMFSNWRNKVEEAAKNQDSFSSFMNMCNLQYMFDAIADGVNIGSWEVMKEYDSENLQKNLETFDSALACFEEMYKKAGIEVKRFVDVDAFVEDYIKA